MLPVTLFPPLVSTQANLQDIHFWEKQKDAQSNHESNQRGYSLLYATKVYTASNDLNVLILFENRISTLAISIFEIGYGLQTICST